MGPQRRPSAAHAAEAPGVRHLGRRDLHLCRVSQRSGSPPRHCAAGERVLPDYSTPWPWDFDSFVVALSVMTHARQNAEQSLENLLASWLGEDPEDWPVFRLTLVEPWQERPGVWSEETPEWVRILGAIAHEHR